jgi:Xaa-Pro dipeptidase
LDALRNSKDTNVLKASGNESNSQTRQELLPQQKLKQWISAQGFDGILIRKRNNFSWLTEGAVNHIVQAKEVGVADLVFLKGKWYCITSGIESRRIMEEELEQFDIELVERQWLENLEEAITQLCAGMRMATDTVFGDYQLVEQELSILRSQLSQPEIARYRSLCQTAAGIIEGTARMIEPGMTEWEIASKIAASASVNGINSPVVLVATDDRILKYRHPLPKPKVMEKSAMLVLCAEQGGLVSNQTRFVHFGKLPAMLEENRLKCAQIDTVMHAETKPGTRVADVFKQALEAYGQAGYPDDWKLLHQGGLTGYATREYLASPQSTAVVRENEAYAWNPAIKGIKSEDTMLVGRHENEYLTHTGEWVYITTEYKGKTYQRPDILVR